MRKDFKCKIEESFSSTYNSKIFNEYKIKKGDLYSKCCEIEYNDAVLHVISDYLQVNVSVLNKFGIETRALSQKIGNRSFYLKLMTKSDVSLKIVM